MKIGIKRIDEGMYRRGYEGLSYQSGMTITEIAKEVRAALKERYPRATWSITTEKFAGGCALNIKLMESPYPEKSQPVEDMLAFAREVIDSFNYNYTDTTIDYFNVNFYEHIGVGKWDKPYKQTATEDELVKKLHEGEGVKASDLLESMGIGVHHIS